MCRIAITIAAVGTWMGAAAAGEPAAPRVRWSVVEAGADPGGKEDSTAAFARALEEAGRAGGGVVEAPAGRYRIDGTLSVPAMVTLQGTYRSAPGMGSVRDGGLSGSVLLARAGRGSEEGAPFVRLAGNNAVLAGFAITYPEWKQADVPPVPYPPCIASVDTENVAVLDCLLLNPYEGIRLVRAHRHLVRNVTGYPIRRGIFVDECYDIGHIENIHFWPFGVLYDPKEPYCLWINVNGVAFELARTDWHYVSNTFCFGYGVGYRFSASKAGSTNGNFLGLGADSCRRAVLVEAAQPPGLLITNGEFVGRWTSTDSVCLEVLPGAEGKVSLVNCSFWGPIDRCIRMRAPSGQLTASACNFVHWDSGGIGSPAIDLEAGKAIVEASTFGQEGLDVRVGEGVVSAILTANQAPAGFRTENLAGRRAVIAANEEDPIEWTDEARRHYRIEIGAEGDGRSIRGWHGAERFEVGGTKRRLRWSMGASSLVLPVVPGEAYRLTLEISVPPGAVGPDSGLYLEGRKLAPLVAGAPTLSVDLPPASGNEVRVEIRSALWVPSKTNPGSKDDRSLGVSLGTVTMRARGAVRSRPFDANAGKWPE
jgi:hypothetical protein